MATRRGRGLWWTAVCAVLSQVGCSEPTDPGSGNETGVSTNEQVGTQTPPGPLARGIILITCDTLRADHLSCYGYDRPTTPGLDAFAAEATRFERAYSTAPWTLPSHASLFTGLYPYEHGAHTRPVSREQIEAGGVGNTSPLDPKFVTLAEALRGLGFTTAAFGSNEAYLSPRHQLGQGFERYEIKRGKSNEINERAIAWLDELSQQQQFFLFLNYMDTHRPYNTKPREGFLPGREIPKKSAPLMTELIDRVMGKGEPPPPEIVSVLRDQYDLGLANLDESLAALFDHLRATDRFDETLIVVTSDHGESFGAHGIVEHGKDVYQQMLHVPLIVKAPAQTEGAVESELISLIHVSGMILDFTRGSPEFDAQVADWAHWPAESVLAENYYARMKDLRRPWGPKLDRVRAAVFHDRYKYIHSDDGQHELYDLRDDPEELVNLYETRAPQAKALFKKLGRLVQAHRRAGDQGTLGPLSPEELEILKNLGYADDG